MATWRDSSNRDNLGRFTSVAWMERRQSRFKARVDFYDKKVLGDLGATMKQRVAYCGQLLRDKVVINLSRPVRKIRGKRSGRVQVDPKSRSAPGEFPRADTTRLMKDIFYETTDDGMSAVVGTTLDYGLIHETESGRSFLRRTMFELRPTIIRILTAGIGGGQLELFE